MYFSLCIVYWIDPDYVKGSVANIFRKCGCSRWYSYESTPADTYQRSIIIASQFLDDIAWVEGRNNCTSMIQYDDLNNLLNDCSLVLQEEHMVQRSGLELVEIQHEENVTHTDHKPPAELLSNEDLKINQNQPSDTGDIEEGVLNDPGSSDDIKDYDQASILGDDKLKNKNDNPKHQGNVPPTVLCLKECDVKSCQNQPSGGDGVDEGDSQDLESAGEKIDSNQYPSKTHFGASKPVDDESKNNYGYPTHQGKKQPAGLLSIENINSSQDSHTAVVDIEEKVLNGLESYAATKDDLQLPQSQYTHVVVPKYPAGCVHANHKDTREVPIFCAICLGEYSISDEVTLARNTECTHVFHRECIGHWLFRTLEKKSSKISLQPLPKSMSLECPMCRQDFVKIMPQYDEETDMGWITLDLDSDVEAES